MESTLGEDAMKTIEMTTKNWDYYINFVDKTVVGFERTDSNFERSSTMSKIVSNSIAWYREIIHESKSQLIQQTSLSYIF